MQRANRLGSALSTLAIAAVLSGCATGQESRSSIFGTRADHENIGLATRAQAALNAGQLTTAVELAERAVAGSPTDAGFRALLGNTYFAAGRFASAEAAYRDSLTLISGQREVILKMALVQIAQGKNAEALSVLQYTRDMLEPANYGLALALAGRPADAVPILNQAARLPGADARVRQNLALAYALSGDWTTARTIAAQDVPPGQLDSRIHQWMAMATPTRPSDQVAALTGITPSADPGMPQQLALVRSPEPVQQAQAQVAAEPVAIPAPAPIQYAPEPVAQAAPLLPVAVPVTVPVAAQAAPEPAPEIASDTVAEAVQTLIEPAPVAAPQPPVEAPLVIETAAVAVSTPAAIKVPASFEVASEPPAFVAISETVRKAAAEARVAKGRSNAVVQLGAYSSPKRVSSAWVLLTGRYPALRNYTPMRARFDSPNGTVWRLSIKGFASEQEAIERCERLQSRGGSCFVRSIAGDAPVQFASR